MASRPIQVLEDRVLRLLQASDRPVEASEVATSMETSVDLAIAVLHKLELRGTAAKAAPALERTRWRARD